VQAVLAFGLALLFTTVIPAIGFVSFIKLVAELMSN
jgi:predicted RND superfamily exporter protein